MVVFYAFTMGSFKKMDLLSLYAHLGEGEVPLRVRQKSREYILAYESLFSKYRGQPVRVLEIGCGYPRNPDTGSYGMGGSLYMWSEYFGTEAIIVGIDIIEACKEYESIAPNIKVEIGSQDDPDFLDKVNSMYGPFDIVIDDGSHLDSHIHVSFDHLYPYLKDGGLYCVEDFWSGHKEGLSFMNKKRFLFKAIDLAIECQRYQEYLGRSASMGILDYEPSQYSAMTCNISEVHFYKGLIAICKRYSEHNALGQMPMPPHYVVRSQ